MVYVSMCLCSYLRIATCNLKPVRGSFWWEDVLVLPRTSSKTTTVSPARHLGAFFRLGQELITSLQTKIWRLVPLQSDLCHHCGDGCNVNYGQRTASSPVKQGGYVLALLRCSPHASHTKTQSTTNQSVGQNMRAEKTVWGKAPD